VQQIGQNRVTCSFPVPTGFQRDIFVLFKLFSRKKKVAAPASAAAIAPEIDAVQVPSFLATPVAVVPAAVPATVQAASVPQKDLEAQATTLDGTPEPAGTPTPAVKKKASRTPAGKAAATKPATRATTTPPTKPAAKPVRTPAVRPQPATSDSTAPAALTPMPNSSAAAAPAGPATPAVTVASLRQQARDLGLSGYSRLTKSDLLALISAHTGA